MAVDNALNSDNTREGKADSLVHMCTREEWEADRSAAQRSPQSLRSEGFIHLSTPEQVRLPANRLFPGRQDVLLLWLDPERLGAPVRWEPGVPGDPAAMRFPHLYGPLPVAAVTAVTEYRPGPDGTFGAPSPPPTA
ncbi:DUF952 domain-containing protein [Nocardia sp. BMG51109]|uniref:DUF952 domain-containing protein n=1 Tax=Nocardia sp. BMG51109 TaxID=1056816 RepID=UPI000464C5B4|nr:DUF952 domain-containing protein [Nocardia sp. BMG51109]